MYVDKIIGYTHHILRGLAINKYKKVLVEYKDQGKGLFGDQWALGPTQIVTMEKIWT